jgi:hypothetical protein
MRRRRIIGTTVPAWRPPVQPSSASSRSPLRSIEVGVLFFSFVLMPATCLAILTLLWITSDPSSPPARSSEGANDRPTSAGLALADLPGVVCGAVLGLYGVYRFVPLPVSGMGICDWTLFYPLESGLWPYDRSEVFDGCSDGASMVSMICGVLSIVCVIAAAAAAVIGKKRKCTTRGVGYWNRRRSCSCQVGNSEGLCSRCATRRVGGVSHSRRTHRFSRRVARLCWWKAWRRVAPAFVRPNGSRY